MSSDKDIVVEEVIVDEHGNEVSKQFLYGEDARRAIAEQAQEEEAAAAAKKSQAPGGKQQQQQQQQQHKQQHKQNKKKQSQGSRKKPAKTQQQPPPPAQQQRQQQQQQEEEEEYEYEDESANVIEVAVPEGKGQTRSSVTSVFLRNLDTSVTVRDLMMGLFRDDGDIVAATVHVDDQHQSVGTAEVQFALRSEALAAVSKHHGKYLKGKRLYLSVMGVEVAKNVTYGTPAPVASVVRRQRKRTTRTATTPTRSSLGGSPVKRRALRRVGGHGGGEGAGVGTRGSGGGGGGGGGHKKNGRHSIKQPFGSHGLIPQAAGMARKNIEIRVSRKKGKGGGGGGALGKRTVGGGGRSVKNVTVVARPKRGKKRFGVIM